MLQAEIRINKDRFIFERHLNESTSEAECRIIQEECDRQAHINKIRRICGIASPDPRLEMFLVTGEHILSPKPLSKGMRIAKRVRSIIS